MEILLKELKNNPMNNIIEKILAVIFIVFIGFALFSALKVGIERSETNECHRWRVWAQKFPLYYSAQWQLEQCQARGVPLPK
jgi:hypothetical protein